MLVPPAHADVVVAYGERAYSPSDRPAIRFLHVDTSLAPGGMRDTARRFLARVAPAPDAAAIRPLLFHGDTHVSRAAFDLFAIARWILDREEERDARASDEHGRYPPEESVLARAGLLDRPVVDECCHAFGLELWRLAGRPASASPAGEWTLSVTLDVDSDGMFLGRRGLRTIRDAATTTGPGLTRVALAGALTLARLRPDPHLRIGELSEQLAALGVPATFFVQTHRAHALDSYALTAGSPLLPPLRRARALGHDIALHSSAAGLDGGPSLAAQFRRLRARGLDPAPLVRAHYLRTRAHGAWTATPLADSSLAYGARCGFRTGTCTPHRLPASHADGGWELPPCAMDSTLRHFENLGPESAFKRMTALLERVRALGGLGVLIVHPQNLEPLFWPGWRELLVDVVQWAVENGARIASLPKALAEAKETRRETLRRLNGDVLGV